MNTSLTADMARFDIVSTVQPYVARFTIDGTPPDSPEDVSEAVHLLFPNIVRQTPTQADPNDPWYWFVRLPAQVLTVLIRDREFAWTEAADDETGETLVSIEIGLGA